VLRAKEFDGILATLSDKSDTKFRITKSLRSVT
jgi:hypothetical protein